MREGVMMERYQSWPQLSDQVMIELSMVGRHQEHQSSWRGPSVPREAKSLYRGLHGKLTVERNGSPETTWKIRQVWIYVGARWGGRHLGFQVPSLLLWWESELRHNSWPPWRLLGSWLRRKVEEHPTPVQLGLYLLPLTFRPTSLAAKIRKKAQQLQQQCARRQVAGRRTTPRQLLIAVCLYQLLIC
jgi:hypothetical protein